MQGGAFPDEVCTGKEFWLQAKEKKFKITLTSKKNAMTELPPCLGNRVGPGLGSGSLMSSALSASVLVCFCRPPFLQSKNCCRSLGSVNKTDCFMFHDTYIITGGERH